MLAHNKLYFTGDYFIRHHPGRILTAPLGAWPKTVVLDLENMTVLAKSDFGTLSAEDILSAVNSENK